MKAEDFDRLSIEELQAEADKRFDSAHTSLEDGTAPIIDDGIRLRLILEAQFFLTAVARKRELEVRKQDEENVRTDRRLEYWVIVLIGLEIILSVVGIVYAVYEGKEQSRVLSNIQKSTQDTAATSADSATAMKEAKQSLVALTKQQTELLGHFTEMTSHLKQMDKSLRTSLAITQSMADTTKSQLKVLQDEQAQLTLKPEIVVTLRGQPLSTKEPNVFPLLTRGEHFGNTILALAVKNISNVPATKFALDIWSDPQVPFQCDCIMEKPNVAEGEEEMARGIEIHHDLQAGEVFNFRLQIPPRLGGIWIYFTGTGEKVSYRTLLGTLHLTLAQ